MSHHKHQQQFLRQVYAELEKVRDKVATEYNTQGGNEFWEAICSDISQSLANLESKIDKMITKVPGESYPAEFEHFWKSAKLLADNALIPSTSVFFREGKEQAFHWWQTVNAKEEAMTN